MELRSRLNPTSVEANLVSVSVGKYTYKIDLLTLEVYDENNTKFKIKDILETALQNKADIKALKDSQEEFSTAQSKSNTSLNNALAACMNYIKALNDQIISLQIEVNKLRKGA